MPPRHKTPTFDGPILEETLSVMKELLNETKDVKTELTDIKEILRER